MRHTTPSLAALATAAALLTTTGTALAQGKGGKPKPPATAEPEPAAPEDPTQAPEPEATEPPADPAAADGDPSSDVAPPREEWDITDVAELPGKTYLFVGVRYRGNIIPKFMLNTFVEEGATVYSNSVGIQLDIRKDGFSLIPALQYTEYGTGDILFKQRNTPDIPGNYSMVNSSMKAIYATADLLWSTPLGKNVEFEYGAGFGFGVVFGDLVNNWVQQDPSGRLVSDRGGRYSPCQTVGAAGSGCNRADHQNSEVDKVGGYTERSWVNGGSKPNVFPWIAIPQVGLRFKPIKNFVARTNLGFSLTGFWFGLSMEYGLEQKPKL
jgi:hypothetical protein